MKQTLKWLLAMGICGVILTSINCPTSDADADESFFVYIITKSIGQAVCPTTDDAAFAIFIEIQLKNYTDVPANILSWRLNFYLDGVVLGGIDHQTYNTVNCNNAALALASPFNPGEQTFSLETTIPQNFFGAFPDQVEATFFFQDSEGNTVSVSNIF
jgi:hypothetical protein